MALTTCRECGQMVSDEAAKCPHCGVSKPTRQPGGAMKAVLVFVGFIVIVTAIGDMVGDDEPAGFDPLASSASPAIPPQGIDSVRAQELWETATGETGITRRWECSVQYDNCTFQLEPSTWAMMDYDLKRDFVTGAGKAAAVIRRAEFTTFVDAYTGDRLARYSARNQSASID